MGAILAPRHQPGGPWEQQDGFEVVDNKIFVDFGMILGPVYDFFGDQNTLNCFLPGLFPGHFFIAF